MEHSFATNYDLWLVPPPRYEIFHIFLIKGMYMIIDALLLHFLEDLSKSTLYLPSSHRHASIATLN